MLDSWRVDTITHDYSAFLQLITAQIEKAQQILNVADAAIGIGMPGLIDANGKQLSANVPCATGQNVAADIAGLLNRPVALQNDTRCFALSEANGGAGSGYSRVFGAIIGTGAAGGFCIDGELDLSMQGIAGEYGHQPLSADLCEKYNLPLYQCGCGLNGCVEMYIAGGGLDRLYNHLAKEHKNAKDWANELANGDSTAQQVLACYMDILGQAFASIVKILEPDVFVLGGGLSLVKQISEQLPDYIERHLFKGFESPPVVTAKFGDSSGVRGAAILARNTVESK